MGMRDRGIVPYRKALTTSARRLRRDPTPAERKLWFEFLRDAPAKFTRQKPLGAFVADFYCSSSRLVIELDGDSHFNMAGERYDENRTASLAKLGLRVLRFTNADVLERFEAVCGRITREIAKS
ncbi:MAG TPA: endonuclease domain-containing protein [Burkholderiales bacterium]|nr:endonuclease domain-containing protein [Burkholderiales bacterium]